MIGASMQASLSGLANPAQAERDAATRDRMIAQLEEAIKDTDQLDKTGRARIEGFDEHQNIQSPEKHRVHVQEIDRDDPGRLGMQELPPARARAPRCRINAGRMQDLPHGRRRDCHAELCEFAVDPAVSPQRKMLSSTFSR